MKKEEFQELCELSEKLYGRKYDWKKLTKKGLVSERVSVGRRGMIARRMPLSYQGAKQYMEMTLKMRDEIKKENAKGSADGSK